MQAQQTETRERTLAIGNSIERELASGESHRYRISLSANHFVRVIVEQRSLDAVLRLFGPDGQQITEVNNWQTPEPERLSLVTVTAGDYQLAVTGEKSAAKGGRYEIRIDESRAATPQDARLIAAERTMAEATLLTRQGTAESMRRASVTYEAVLREWREIGYQPGEAQTLTYLGHVNVNSSRYQKAIEYYQSALQLWRKLAHSRFEADTINSIGWAYQGIGETQKALDQYTQALPLREALGDARGQAQTLTGMGTMYTKSGEAQLAFDAYTRALSFADIAGDQTQKAFALTNLGLLDERMDESQKAIDLLRQALSIWRSVGNRHGEAEALNNLGIVYYSRNDLLTALEYHQQSLQLWTAAGHRYGEAQQLNNIGADYHKLADTSRSLANYERALQIWREIGNRPEEARTLTNIGYVYSTTGDQQKALSYFHQALGSKTPAEYRASDVPILYRIGFAYSLQSDLLTALNFLNQALPLSRAGGNRRDEMWTLYVLAIVHWRSGQLDQALAESESAIAIFESLRSKVAAQELRATDLAFQMPFYKFKIRVLMQMHLVDPSKGYDAVALRVSESGRARSLLEMLEEAGANIRQGVEPQLLARESELQFKFEVKETTRLRLLGGKQPEQLAALEEEFNELLRQKQEVIAQIRASSPRYAALTRPEPLSLQQIQQQLLDDDSLLLEFSLLSTGSYLWAVTKNSISSFELAGEKKIEMAARRVYELLTAPNLQIAGETPEQRHVRLERAATEYPKAAAALSQMLLSPVASQLGHKRLLIIADDFLQYIPFGALPKPQGQEIKKATGDKTHPKDNRRPPRNAQPLIVDHEIVTLPSASVLAVVREATARRTVAPKLLAVLADPVFRSDDQRVLAMAVTKEQVEPVSQANVISPRVSAKPETASEVERSARESGLGSFARLRFSRHEAEAISGFAPRDKKLTALDFAANRQKALSPELGQYRIIHFATHGLLNNSNPALSGIVLSLVDNQGQPQNGFLRLHEIYNLKLNAELVVLSACQTALGKEIRGEGLIGLTRGFMYAGAPRVVASLWRVDDRATAELMRRFYKGMLRDKLRPAAALRAAQISILKERNWNAPYFWAAFTLQGEWR